MSTIEADTLHAWLTKSASQTVSSTGSPADLPAGTQIKLLFTTMPGGTAAKHATLHNVENTYIEHSIYFDFQSQFADASSSLSNTMCSTAQFETQAQALGLNNSDTIVVYDNYGNFCASRVWYMLMAMGAKHVYLLNGGLPKWRALGYPVVEGTLQSIGSGSEVHKGDFQAKANNEFRFIGQNEVSAIIAKQTNEARASCIIDARGAARFSGEIPDPRPQVRSGHIPTSLNLYYGDLQDEWGAFLPLSTLRDKFSATGLLPKQLVFSCGSGVTACILAQAAHMLGVSPLSVYDGSWSQWGANAELEIATGA